MYGDSCENGTRAGAGWRAALTLAAGLVAAATSLQADVYRWVDADGVTHYTDRPIHSGYQRVIRDRRAGGTFDARRMRANRKRYAGLIAAAARRHQLEPALVHAVIRAESAYDPKAVSRAGAVGLMQLMPQTARRYRVRDRRDPEQNVEGGVRYLRDLLQQFGSLDLALAAYNAGEGAVQRHGNRIPPYRETQNYVRKVQHFLGKERRL